MGSDGDVECFPIMQGYPCILSCYARVLNHDTVLKDSDGDFLYTVKAAGHNCFKSPPNEYSVSFIQKVIAY